MLLVDEAHATGLMGSHGGGLTQALSLEDRVDVRVGTLSKALGGMGGFAAGSRAMAELIINRARSLVFSTGIAPTACASALAALDVIEVSTALRERLWSHVHAFSKGAPPAGGERRAAVAHLPGDPGDPSTALAASEALRERGVLVKAIRPPTVPAGTSRLRFSVSAARRARSHRGRPRGAARRPRATARAIADHTRRGVASGHACSQGSAPRCAGDHRPLWKLDVAGDQRPHLRLPPRGPTFEESGPDLIVKVGCACDARVQRDCLCHVVFGQKPGGEGQLQVFDGNYEKVVSFTFSDSAAQMEKLAAEFDGNDFEIAG